MFQFICVVCQATLFGGSYWIAFTASAYGWPHRWHCCLAKAGGSVFCYGRHFPRVLASWNKRRTPLFAFHLPHFRKTQQKRSMMACCGQRRRQISRAVPVQRSNWSTRAGSSRPLSASPQSTAFQYVGKTALTAVGPLSGRHYRFSHPGATVEVDPRDRASLALVPHLRQA
jgi:hypothetical protein